MGRGGGWLGVVGGVVMVGLFVLWPLPGYIHPDEFFQSTEVVAGDIFNVSHLRTWEFNPGMPLRDITLPYLLYAPGFYCLRWLLTNHGTAPTIAESYAVLVIPRIVLALAGAVNVCLILKLCAVFAVNRGVAVWLWLTAYTTWTFLLRPFSNTSETLLLSVVCVLLLETLPAYRGKLRSSGEKDSPPTRQLKEKESLTSQRSAKVVLCHFLLGAVLCVGFFNRPTFVVFVAVPLLWWADQLYSSRHKTAVVSVLFLVGGGFLLMFVALSVSNSFYYNPDFGHLLEDVFVALSQWNGDTFVLSVRAVMAGLRIPPWCFVQYNMAAMNLAEHGLHPWYTHLLVHLPSLLGPWVLLFYADLLRLVVRFRQKRGTDVLYAAVVIPVLCLSLFPHQEARFLLPVLPLAVVCVAQHPLASWKSVQALALVFNLLGLVMLGVVHQGGVVPALSSLQVRLKQESAQPSSSTESVRYHVISYSTYMLPRHLLFMNQSAVEVRVHDMIGAHNHPPTLRVRVEKLASACVEDSVRCRFWLLLPAPALADLQGWGVREEGEFCPHVSVERLPVSGGVSTWGEVREVMSELCLKVVSVTL